MSNKNSTPRFRGNHGTTNAKVQGGAKLGGSKPVSVEAHPLKLGFTPGSEGLGRVAATVKVGFPETNTINSNTVNMAIPTVAVVRWCPTLGMMTGNTDANVVSAALFKMYNTIRSRNASISAYSPSSILFALEAVTGVAMIFGLIRKRLEILCSCGSQLTTAYPDQLMHAHGLTTTDRDNLASYIAKYNQLVELSKGLIMPKQYKLFARRATLAGTVYLDDPLIQKSQLISMEPTNYWRWNLDATSADVGKLVLESWSYNTIPSMMATLENRLTEYLMDVDMNNIYAELRKAFLDAEVYHIMPFPVDGEPLNVTFDQVLLDQLHNGTLCGAIKDTPKVIESSGVIRYESYYIKVQPTAQYTVSSPGTVPFKGGSDAMNARTYYQSEKLYLYSHSDQPDEYDIMDLNAFKAYLVTGGSDFNYLQGFGTEVLLNIDLYYTDNYYVIKGLVASIDFSVLTGSQAAFDSICGIGRLYNSFAYLPVFYISIVGGYTSVITFEGDIDNRFPISTDSCTELHRNQLAWLISM